MSNTEKSSRENASVKKQDTREPIEKLNLSGAKWEIRLPPIDFSWSENDERLLSLSWNLSKYKNRNVNDEA